MRGGVTDFEPKFCRCRKMSVSKKTVELFYDVISPYTWFAFEVNPSLYVFNSLNAITFRIHFDKKTSIALIRKQV